MRVFSALLLGLFLLMTTSIGAYAIWKPPSLLTSHKTAGRHVKAAKPVEQALPEYVMIETQRGNMVVRLYAKEAPKTVAHFVKLMNKGFYNQNGMTFHRVVPGFVVQTGDPTGTGLGGSGDNIPLEVQNHLTHEGPGVVAMARSSDPDSASSQFYITLTSQQALDGKYAIFGRVIRGVPLLTKIHQGDVLYGIHPLKTDELPPPDPTPANKIMGRLKTMRSHSKQQAVSQP